MPNIIYNTIGSLGVLCILTTYFLLQTDRVKSHQLRYSVLNLAGSSMILFSLFFEFNLPSFIVEVAWVMISLMGVGRWVWNNRSKQ